MNLGGVEICCPRCRGELSEVGDSDSTLRCRRCDASYPVIAGIPDLRVFPDPYIDLAADRAKGLRLTEGFADFDFAGLVDFYYSMTPEVPAKHARQYKRGLRTGVARAEAALGAWEAADDGPAHFPRDSLLEIGCGTAPLLVAASRRFSTLAGVDIAFRWLVVAKKRLSEAGLDCPLLCACAEALPLRSATFDCVAADSVLEVVRDQADALQEARRVLRPGGQLWLATPNRFSLGPDPHVGLWGGSLLPRRWLAAYTRWQGGIPPKRNLLSALALSRLLRRAGFARHRIFLPSLSAGQRRHFSWAMNRVIDVYHAAKRLPISRQLLSLFGPLFYAVGVKVVAKPPPSADPRA